MLETTKCVLNSLNQVKYLRNRDRVHMSMMECDSGNCNNVRTISGKMDKIDELQTKNRVNNLRVFSRNYRKLRWRRFWFISLPAILTALTVGSFLPPKRIPVRKDIPAYERTVTYYNSLYGETTSTEVGYVIDKDLSSYQLPQGETEFSNKNVKDSVRLQIYNDDDYLNANVNISSNDLLNVTQVYTGDHYDFTDYDEMTFTDDAKKYDALYDKLVQIIKESELISEENLAVLDKLTEDEKKTVVIEVEKYVSLGNVNIKATKSKTFMRIVLIVMLIISLVIDWLYYDDKKLDTFSFKTLNHGNGELYECSKEIVNLFYESLKYKEAYLAAERERLLLLDEEIKRNVSVPDQDRLTTKYEKKIIKKAKSEREKSLSFDR